MQPIGQAMNMEHRQWRERWSGDLMVQTATPGRMFESPDR